MRPKPPSARLLVQPNGRIVWKLAKGRCGGSSGTGILGRSSTRAGKVRRVSAQGAAVLPYPALRHPPSAPAASARGSPTSDTRCSPFRIVAFHTDIMEDISETHPSRTFSFCS